MRPQQRDVSLGQCQRITRLQSLPQHMPDSAQRRRVPLQRSVRVAMCSTGVLFSLQRRAKRISASNNLDSVTRANLCGNGIHRTNKGGAIAPPDIGQQT